MFSLKVNCKLLSDLYCKLHGSVARSSFVKSNLQTARTSCRANFTSSTNPEETAIKSSNNFPPQNCIFKNACAHSKIVQHKAYSTKTGIQGKVKSLLSDNELSAFTAEFPNVIKDLVGLEGLEKMTETNAWVTKVAEYNVPHGKLIRPLLLIKTAKLAQDKFGLQEELPNLNRIAWSYEFLHAFITIVDDIMDSSKTRRNRPCWYLVNDLGHAAINDGILLETCAYALLKKYMKGVYPLYGEIVDMVHDTILKCLYGERMDVYIASRRDYSKVSMDLYKRIKMFTNGFYTFYAPIAMGLLMNGFDCPKTLKKLETFSLDLVLFYCVQDDFLDYFNDPEKSGKIGTDIEDGKLSWLFVTALTKANNVQRCHLLENYGRDDAKHVKIVKEIYEEMNLTQTYRQYERDALQTLKSQLNELSSVVPTEHLHELITLLFGRNR